ncbi:MAG: hypothetical protein ACLGHN_12000 [Bacteriovoracia bacterium]
MKKLIFLSLFASISALAASPEVATPEDGKQIVSTIKDIEISKLISDTKEFKDCRKDYEYKENNPNKDQELKAAVACFQKELVNIDDPKRLEQLSDSLNLQTYGLVKSNNAKEIQKYLTDKMIESITGVNPDEKDQQKLKESLKFGKKKVIDQSLFIKMYKTQLGKNALFEISRFCFQNLRSNSGTGKANFIDHWGNDISKVDLQSVNDSGEPVFGNKFSDPSDKKKLYTEIFSSIQGSGNSNPQATQQFLSKFFIACGQLIKPLCDEFKKEIAKTPDTSQVELKNDKNKPETTKGSAACLAQSRIQEYKQALLNADKIAKYFEEEMDGKNSNHLSAFMIEGLKGKPIGKALKRYGDGSDKNEASIDEITNNSSLAFLEGQDDPLVKDKAKECEDRPEIDGCEGFIFKDDTLGKVKHKVEFEMTLKREVEMKRVRKLKEQNDQDLKKYLEENAFYDLLKDDKYLRLTKDELAKEVGESFEAKKRATLAEINNRLGSRQVKTDAELKAPGKAAEIVKNSTEERARMSQLVLFNNIIVSHLSLKKKLANGQEVDAGRNVGAWKKEEEALAAGNIDETLFANLKASDDGSSGGVGNNEISGFGIIDDLLGKPKEN